MSSSPTVSEKEAANSPYADVDEASQHFQGLDNQNIAADALGLYDHLASLDLVENVSELAIKGLTVIPPEKIGPTDLVERVRGALLDTVERRSGTRLNWREGEHEKPDNPFGKLVSYLLLEDPVFLELLMKPAILAMPTWKLGMNCCISSFQSIIKGAGGPELNLHADELMVPMPYSAHPGGFNVTYIMTDYTRENGCLAYVPGSHLLHRQPVGFEGRDCRMPVEAPAGSVICWDGNLWHGAYPRRTPGLRMSLSIFFSRPHMRPQEEYRDEVSQEMLDRHPERLRTILGKNLSFGTWKEEGPVLDGSETLIGSTPFR